MCTDKNRAVSVLLNLAFFSWFGAQSALAGLTDDFVTIWDTNNPGTSGSTSITVPMVGGPYDVDWDNDGTFDDPGLSGPVTHDFGSAGTYTIRIQGSYDSIGFNNGGDKEKLLSIIQWGTNAWTSMESAFRGAINLQVPATDTPDFSAVTDMSFMFFGATLADPNTSNWDTAAVTTMLTMFLSATSANPNTSGWNTAAVTDMSFMFLGATSAKPDTGNWDTAAVTTMSNMFASATLANPDTSGWNTAAVTTMRRMFQNTTSANPDTRNWDTAAVTTMLEMFSGATSAEPDTNGWNTAKVTTMRGMFWNATLANPDTSNWNTVAVTDMSNMFSGATLANPDTSGWNTAAVTKMSFMFQNATSFDQDIGSWIVAALRFAGGMFSGVTLSTANYDSLLVGWDAQVLKATVTFSGGNSRYCSAPAIAARANMIAADSWVITDAGQCVPPELESVFTDSFEGGP